MIHQDYIMRMIEQLTNVLAKIFFKKETKNYNEALTDINTASKTIVGLDLNLLEKLSADDIRSLLRIAGDDSTICMKFIAIAKLLKEKTDILRLTSQDNPEFISNYQKAISLYLEGMLNNKNTEIDLSRFYLDVKEIVNVLKDEINPETRFKLFKFYSQSGKYSLAANELFRLKEKNYPGIEEAGISFFRNLEKLSEDDLRKGNPSIEEVSRGIKDFI